MAVTWSAPSDPTVYLPVNYDVTKVQEYLLKINSISKGVKITMTHIFTKALFSAMSRNRRDIGRLSWGYFKKSEKVGITILVDIEGGKDLIPITLWEGQDLSVIELA